MKMQTRRGVKAARNVTVAAAAVLGLVLGSTGTAGAEVDDQNRIVSDGVEVIVSQEDTNIWGVPPIGGSPMSREWFHDGRALVNVVGEDADDFAGTVQIGYQVAWPAAVDGSVGFAWSSPSLQVKQTGTYEPVTDANNEPVYVKDSQGREVTDAEGKRVQAYRFVPGSRTDTVKGILPQATAGIELTPAPGIEEVVVGEGDIEGDFKEIQIAAVHGAAAGVVGPVSLRPFVRVISDNGDNVTTYGKVWTL